MDSITLSSLSLFAATPEQIFESRRRTYAEWSGGLSLEEYLARDEFTDKQEVACEGRLITWVLAPRSNPTSLDFLCSCETFRRDGLVCSKANAKPKRVKAISPREWGAPPHRVAHAGDGLFSALWSDVGAEFYRRCGPTKDSDGWITRAPFSTIWDVKQESSSIDTSGWTLLDETGVMKLWEDDAENISRTLSPADNFQVSFSYLPHKGVAAFQHWRTTDILNKRGYAPIHHWGIIRDSNTFATWTFDIQSSAKTLLITRLKSSPENMKTLLAILMSVARKHGMERIEVYNLPDHLQSSAAHLGGLTVERDDHLPSFKWYGEEHSSEIAWLMNERFCWC
ncbi:Lysine acetyltransferase [Termitomyces sp. T112]|nr:Lysine acetyltransferase [Termitomyces sp. T112]